MGVLYGLGRRGEPRLFNRFNTGNILHFCLLCQELPSFGSTSCLIAAPDCSKKSAPTITADTCPHVTQVSAHPGLIESGETIQTIIECNASLVG
jgi:hypothetical protein